MLDLSLPDAKGMEAVHALRGVELEVEAGEWVAIVGLGLLPVGAAFYAWDYGVKNGDIQIIGGAPVQPTSSS